MKSIKYFAAISFGIIVLIGCYRAPDDNVFYEDLDLVHTNYDVNRLSGSMSYPKEYQTFVIADSIGFASNTEDENGDIVKDYDFRNNIRTTVNNNMLDYGYVAPTLPTDTPDIYVSLTVTYINTKGVSYYPIYWGGGGYGYGYPSYGWGGSYYYPSYSWVPSYYSYDQGSLIIDWMDLKNAEPRPAPDTTYNVNVVWDLTISGLIRNSTDADRNIRLKAAIDQGFKQSPYLKN